MRHAVWMVAMVALAVAARAADGQLVPVACPIDQVPDLRALFASEPDFFKPPEPKGTVNPHAVVAIVRGAPMPIAVALDSEKADAKAPDLVRLDFSGKGEFAGSPALPLKSQGGNANQLWATFGPTALTVQRNGKSLPVMVQGSYNRSSASRFINVQLGAALEGRLAFGAKTYAVRVIDGDGDLAFGTKPTAAGPSGRARFVSPCDSISIDTGDGSFRQNPIRAYYGQPVRVDGAWYEVELSPDGTQISAKPYAGELAQVRIAQEHWSATLVGDKHILKLEGSTEPIPIPADRYTVLVFEQSVPYSPKGAPAGSMARLTSRPGGRVDSPVPILDAVAGKTIELTLGAPLTASIAATVNLNGVRMDLSVTAAAGMVAQVLLPNVGIVTPGVEVLDAAGQRAYEGQFQFG